MTHSADSARPAALPDTFRALLLTKDGDAVRADLTDVPTASCPPVR